ncbi:MAG: hypothetical protein JRI77_09570 [Deltaproteobacteria bacterium]|nr:hypothetical protein [Deltaproteobacteria bacterium]
MRSATELIEYVESSGGFFRLVKDRLRVKAPREVLTDDLLRELKAVKTAIIAELERRNFRRIEVPSQIYPGQIDVWLLGARIDRPRDWKAWYVGIKKQNSEEDITKT